ncbi:MAG: leucine-rich repeat domain-containing protein, partial [Clostridia bacterium]|nr:leucine-rich repeat domain-containing protein [Clostridia bacterium]
GLTSLKIGGGLKSIGSGAFSGCCGLESIVVSTDNSVYDSRNNCNAIIETATNTLLYGCENTIITSSVSTIGSYAFYTCAGLTSIVVPDNITSIGSGAFSYSGLTSIVISARVTSIEFETFFGCSDLTSITIPSSVTRIASFVFDGCENLTTAKFENPNGWVEIVENGYDEIEVPVTVTSDFTEENANVLKRDGGVEVHLLRKDI